MSATLTINTVLAKQILDTFKAKPERHAQSTWGEFIGWNELDRLTALGPERKLTREEEDCNTTCCVAGYAALITGNAYFTTHNKRLMIAEGTPEAEFEDWKGLGARLLGLPENEAHRLFFDTTDDQAVAALEYLVKGELPDWNEVGWDGQSDGDDEDEDRCPCGFC